MERRDVTDIHTARNVLVLETQDTCIMWVNITVSTAKTSKPVFGK